jgi:hypothetical protein
MMGLALFSVHRGPGTRRSAVFDHPFGRRFVTIWCRCCRWLAGAAPAARDGTDPQIGGPQRRPMRSRTTRTEAPIGPHGAVV